MNGTPHLLWGSSPRVTRKKVSNVDSFVCGSGLTFSRSLSFTSFWNVFSLLFVTRHLADSTNTESNHETLLLTVIGRETLWAGEEAKSRNLVDICSFVIIHSSGGLWCRIGITSCHFSTWEWRAGGASAFSFLHFITFWRIKIARFGITVVGSIHVGAPPPPVDLHACCAPIDPPVDRSRSSHYRSFWPMKSSKV